MPTQPSIIVYCVPQCGHARAVIELLRRRHLPFMQRIITSDAAAEITGTYQLYGSPILVIEGEVLTGTDAILARIEGLAAAG